MIGLSGAVLGAAIGVGTSLLWVRVNFRILIGYIGKPSQLTDADQK